MLSSVKASNTIGSLSRKVGAVGMQLMEIGTKACLDKHAEMAAEEKKVSDAANAYEALALELRTLQTEQKGLARTLGAVLDACVTFMTALGLSVPNESAFDESDLYIRADHLEAALRDEGTEGKFMAALIRKVRQAPRTNVARLPELTRALANTENTLQGAMYKLGALMLDAQALVRASVPPDSSVHRHTKPTKRKPVPQPVPAPIPAPPAPTPEPQPMLVQRTAA